MPPCERYWNRVFLGANMRKRDELTDPKSCLNRAGDDEWVFVLLGRDAAAPTTVLAWVGERLRLGKNRLDDPQIVEAINWAETVRAEQERLPDKPAGKYHQGSGA